MQSNVDQLREEKERLLNSLVESEWVAFHSGIILYTHDNYMTLLIVQQCYCMYYKIVWVLAMDQTWVLQIPVSSHMQVYMHMYM